MRTSIEGERALVTGAGSGIGRAIALRLVTLGCTVALVGRREGPLEETRALCEEAAGKSPAQRGAAAVRSCDLTDEKSVEALVEQVTKDGGLDILINNAGIVQSGPFESVSTELFDRVMATNVRAPFLLTRGVLPLLRKSDSAEIINICSVVAHEGYPNQSIYATSKHALLGMTKSLANEVYKDGIRVHAISPGGVLTEMIAQVRPELVGTPMITPDDIADSVEFLLCHRGDAVCDEVRLHRSTKAPF